MTAEVRIVPNRSLNEAALKRLRKLAKDVGDTTGVNRQVSIWLLRWVNDNFRSEGGKVGGWPPFKLGGRRKRGGGIDRTAKLLQDTGRLRASIQPFHSRRNAGVGSAIIYAGPHDTGLPRRGLPQRRILPIDTDSDVEKSILRIYEVDLQRKLR